MSYGGQLVRTSVSLDAGTLETMDSLAKRWSVSKAEVMRRAIRRVQQDVEDEDKRPSPLQAMEWLQNGAGLTVAEGAQAKAHIEAERQAAEEAARLFNLTGRRRGSHADCMIAASAIVAGAPLATLNAADFQPLVPFGLSLQG